MVYKELFGGAIAVDDFPDNLIDASDLRQVPDSQEVFLYPDSGISIVVEVLQRVPAPSDAEAAKVHFEALADDNSAHSYTMQVPFVDRNNRVNQEPPIILRGSQRVCKFNAVDADEVDISIALFRVRSRGKCADVVVSENIPKDTKDGLKERAAAGFDSLVSSFHIIDYGLFC